MKRKVLIFGINGFVGKYLAHEMLDAGYIVYGSDIEKSLNMPPEVNYMKINLLDMERVQKIITDVSPDMVINLVAISSVGLSWNNPQKTVLVNVIGAINIMEALKNRNDKTKIMFIGSSEEYAASFFPIDETSTLDSNNPYGISKITQERFASLYREQYGMNIYYVRSFNHTGVGQEERFVLPSFCKQAAEIKKSGKSGSIITGNLNVKRDFTHVKDVVRAYRMIIESDNCEKIYNVGFGRTYGLDELLKYVINMSGQDITVKIDQKRIRQSEQPFICCDNSLIKKELGWEHEYTVFDALEELFESYAK